jgi:hypothetical protein
MLRAGDPEPEPCTRLAAVEGGWRFAAQHPGEVLVLQHSGCEGNRWQCRGASLEHGRAVAEFKRLRETVVHGALALWHAGRVSRYEMGELTRTGT